MAAHNMMAPRPFANRGDGESDSRGTTNSVGPKIALKRACTYDMRKQWPALTAAPPLVAGRPAGPLTKVGHPIHSYGRTEEGRGEREARERARRERAKKFALLLLLYAAVVIRVAK